MVEKSCVLMKGENYMLETKTPYSREQLTDVNNLAEIMSRIPKD